MTLPMARPWQDKSTHVYHLRQRTPVDLLARLKGTRITLPVGDRPVTVKVGDVVQVSLRTKDKGKAKELHAIADAALRRQWEAQRHGPSRLTQKQVTALAGTFYRDFTRAIEDDPGSPETWADVQGLNERARQGLHGFRSKLIIGDHEDAKAVSMRERFGALADSLLRREGSLWTAIPAPG